MDHLHTSSSPVEPRKFPVKTLLFAAAILAGAAAVLVFNVPVFTVLTYGFLGLMLFGCSFMHAGHGGHDHGGSSDQPGGGHIHPADGVSTTPEHMHADGPATPKDEETTAKKDTDTHQGHSGHSGC